MIDSQVGLAVIASSYCPSPLRQSAASLTTAKPAALYELKDQGSITLLLRAQRNW